jgi:regulatory protein
VFNIELINLIFTLKKWNKIMIYNVELAVKKMEGFCGYQERCLQEVDFKLNSMKIGLGVKEKVIRHLLENDFLNEERFAKVYARGKFRIKKWGRHRIIRELKRKNITKPNINLALQEINEVEYYKTFNDLAKKRFLEIKESNTFKKRKKLADYLLYRGWESDAVYKIVLELIP